MLCHRVDGGRRLSEPSEGLCQAVRIPRFRPATDLADNSGSRWDRSDTPAKTTGVYVLSASYYQLTHDYLVPSLRKWLASKLQETHRGRASLLLKARTDHWKTAGKTTGTMTATCPRGGNT